MLTLLDKQWPLLNGIALVPRQTDTINRHTFCLADSTNATKPDSDSQIWIHVFFVLVYLLESKLLKSGFVGHNSIQILRLSKRIYIFTKLIK